MNYKKSRLDRDRDGLVFLRCDRNDCMSCCVKKMEKQPERYLYRFMKGRRKNENNTGIL